MIAAVGADHLLLSQQTVVKVDLANSFGLNEIARSGRFELPTPCFEGAQYKTLSAASGVAYEGTRHLSRS